MSIRRLFHWGAYADKYGGQVQVMLVLYLLRKNGCDQMPQMMKFSTFRKLCTLKIYLPFALCNIIIMSFMALLKYIR